MADLRRRVARALVLSRVNYGEADRILTVLTHNQGVQTVIAKGSRRLKSKLAGGVELFCISEITYIPGRGEINTLVSSQMTNSYLGLLTSYEHTQAGYEILKWLKTNLHQEAGEDYFEILAQSLALLEDSFLSVDLAKAYFYSRVLKTGGTSPDPWRDANGQRLPHSLCYGYDTELGVFVPSEGGVFTDDDIKLLRLMLTVEPTVLGKIKLKSKPTRLSNLLSSLANGQA